ncbi:MAG: hypothetical protein ABIN25_09365, partial [Ginsengibacter sp.]
KVFTQKTAEGQEPVPQPIRDAQGNIDDTKLSNRLPEDQGDDDGTNTEQKVIPKNNIPAKKVVKKK